MKILLASETDQALWDNYVLQHKDATPYHIYAWRQSIEAAYGHKGYYFMAVTNNKEDNNQKAIGVLPLIHLKPPFGTGALVSLPYCDISGPLFDGKNAEQQLITEALLHGKKIGVNEVELRDSKSASELKIDSIQIKTHSHKVRMILDLPESSELLFKNFKSKLRSQIRKPEKEDLLFEWGDIDALNDFYHIFSINMKDLGSPVHSQDWFRSIINFYGDKARMGLVYKEREPIGCGIILLANNTVTIPWASTLRKYNHLSPNMMLYWNFLAFAADNGYAHFDFGRSTPEEGTYKFKAQWGAKPNPLYWHHFLPNSAKSTEKSTIQEGKSAKREMAANLWSKLPLCVANTLGPKIRKYISL